MDFDQTDLVEIRIRLSKWQQHSPLILNAMLDVLLTDSITQKAVQESKICKTLKTLAELDLKKQKEGFFSLQQYQQTIQKAKMVHSRLKNIKNGTLVLTKQKQIKPITQQKLMKVPQINLFSDWQESPTDYVQRLPYLNSLVKSIVYNLQQKLVKDNMVEEFEDTKIKEVVIMMEKTIYQRNYQNKSRKQGYDEDLKTLAKFLNSDKSGNITIKLLTGNFSPFQAAQLKSEDWIDQDKKIEQLKIRQKQLIAHSIFCQEDLKRVIEETKDREYKDAIKNEVVTENKNRKSDTLND